MKTLEKFRKEIDEFDRWQKNTILGKLNSFWWKIVNKYDEVLEILNTIKHWYQRAKNGYSYQDVWSLDSYLDEMLPKALRELAKVNNGYPQELESLEEWNDILEEMVQGFEAHKKISELEFDIDNPKEYKELENKFKKGMKLFVRYYGSLWW